MNKSRSMLNILLNQNFLIKNKCLYNFRKLNSQELSNFLQDKGFINASLSLSKHNINGLGFIIIMTDSENFNMLRDIFHLTLVEIENLKNLYIDIFKFRRIKCEDFNVDEIPLYK